MPFTPSTIVRLCNAPLQSDNKNQLTFATVAAQTAYFQGRTVRIFTDFTYQRKDNIIRVPVHADNLYNVNYVMYDNSNFSNKWFYAFVTEIEYINDNTTALHIKTDVFQTWQFDLIYHDSFVVRQHVFADNFAAYLEPEPIKAEAFPVSKVGIGSTDNVNVTNQNIILYFSKPPTAGVTVQRVGFNSGSISMQYGKVYTNTTDLQTDLNLLEAAGEMGLINDVGICFFGDMTVTQDTVTTYDFIQAPLTPKNQKSYMFCYARLVGSTDYKITINEIKGREVQLYSEMWWGSSPFAFCQIRNIPNCVVEYTSFPTANITVSTFENNIMHNLKVMNNLNRANFLINSVSSAASGRHVSTSAARVAETGISNLADEIAQYNRLESDTGTGDQLSGFKSSTATFNAGYAGIYLIKYAPNPEQFQRIDDYFTMFGYARNRILPINFNNRPQWDFIQTKNIDVSGDLPQNDLEELKNIFDSGCTFWHNPNTFGDYSQNNNNP